MPKIDRELWLVQQEYFLSRTPGADPDYTKMLAERPDVIAFNGYADFTLRGEGAYPFVDHNFASMAKGAMGALLTAHAAPNALSGF